MLPLINLHDLRLSYPRKKKGGQGIYPETGEHTWAIPPIEHEGIPDALGDYRALYTGVPWLDGAIRGFRPSSITLLDSRTPLLSGLLSRICVEAVSDGTQMVFVDGGNSIDPYTIAGMGKSRRLDPRHILGRINVSRGFTAYQLATLINDRLEDVIKRSEASTLVVSRLVDMYHDKDIPWNEAVQLVKRSMAEIKKVTKKYNLVTIITCQDSPGQERRRTLGNMLYRGADKIVRLELDKAGLKVTMPLRGDRYHYPRAEDQAMLEDFSRGYLHGQDRGHL